MDRERMNRSVFERLRPALGKYRYAIAAALFGILLMLLPAGRAAESAAPRTGQTQAVSTQAEMEALLSALEGTGELRLMLTVEPGTERWAGAVVVCEGGGSASVRLELTRAVSALTGLSTDRITIMKGKP